MVFDGRERQQVGIDGGGVAQGDSPHDRVRQLADVAGPGVVPQGGERRAGELDAGLVESARRAVEYALGDSRDVVAAVPQRRQAQRRIAEMVEEFGEEVPVGGELPQVVVRGRDDADVRHRRCRSDRRRRPLAEQVKQAGLGRERHEVDVLDEQGPAVRGAGQPAVRALAWGGREVVAEQRGFDRRLGGRCAVERCQWRVAAVARLVEDLGDERLAGARLALDQYRAVRARGLEDALLQFADRRGAADDRREVADGADGGGESRGRSTYRRDQPVRFARPRQVVGGAAPHGFDGLVDARRTGDQHHGYGFRERDRVFLGEQLRVGEHRAHAVAVGLARPDAAGPLEDVEAAVLKQRA